MTRRLVDAGCIAAAAEARRLAAATDDAHALDALVRRRELGEPLAWLLGSTAFCGHQVLVDRGVYVPRHQSEELAHRAAELLPDDGFALDLCTGSGAVAVHLIDHAPRATVVAADRDLRAVRCARRNGVAAVVADVGDHCWRGRFDVVTAVAPYVPTTAIATLPADVRRHEPPATLHGGIDGLDIVRQVVTSAIELVRPGGWLLTEIGGDQGRSVATMLRRAEFGDVTHWYDDDGDQRGVAACFRPG